MGVRMRQREICRAWVVYRMTLSKDVVGGNVVCEQREWDAIELARPGLHLLIRDGIGTEQEAEKLARGTAGDTRPRKVGPKVAATLIGMLNTPPAVAS
jgi:hypothetical protein